MNCWPTCKARLTGLPVTHIQIRNIDLQKATASLTVWYRDPHNKNGNGNGHT